MPPVPIHLASSTNSKLTDAYVPLCDILCGAKRKLRNEQKQLNLKEESSSDEEEAPRVMKKRIVKIISHHKAEEKDINYENIDKMSPFKDKENDTDYKNIDMESSYKPKRSRHEKDKILKEIERARCIDNKKEIFTESKANGLSSYEKMIEEKRAERIALLKSMEIDQVKAELLEVVSTIKQTKKIQTRSYEQKKYPNPPVRRSKRLAKIEVEYSEKSVTDMAIRNSFQYSLDNDESIPSELTFKDALKSGSTYEDCIKDISVSELNLQQDFVLYDKAVLKNMRLRDFNVCKVVPARITAQSWYPSKEELIIAAGDKYGSFSLWKIMDSEETKPHLFKIHTSGISNMQFNMLNPVQLTSSSYDGTMRCCDLVKYTFDEIYNVSDETRCTYFDFISSATYLVSHSNGKIALLDKRTKSKTSEKRHSCHDYSIKTVNVHPVNRNVFVTADNKKNIRIWDLRKLQKNPVVEIMHHKRTVNSAYFSPVTGNSILTTSLDDTICIFDSTNLTENMKLKTMIKHNNFTGRWLSIFRATWLPNSDDAFVVGCVDLLPRMIQIFDKDMNLYHNMQSMNLTTITSLHRFHPFRPAVAGGNSSGKLFVFT